MTRYAGPIPSSMNARTPLSIDPFQPLPWMDRAACVGHPDPDMWYRTDSASINAATEVCATCPVRAACRDYAIATKQVWGVWAGVDRSSGIARRRQMQSRVCRNGHERTPENTGSDGRRGSRCLQCDRDARKRRRAEMRAAQAGGKNAWAEMVAAS